LSLESQDDLSSLALDDDLSLESAEESAADELSSFALDEDLSLEGAEESSAADELSSLALDDDLPLEGAEESSVAEELSLDDSFLDGLDNGESDSQQDIAMVDDDLDLNALGLDEESAGDKIDEKLDLVQIYMGMNENDSARDILKDILEQGDEEQKRKAQELIAEIS
jgi:pilus assembly protein FimV